MMSADDSDVCNCYGDLWKTASERKNEQYQGIDTSGDRNTMRICRDAGDKDETVAADKAIADASYDIENISLEFEIVTLPKLARMIANQYNGRPAILYDRILRHRKISRHKSDTLWNINFNVPARSMKGVLMLFEDVAAKQPFARNTESFYNPKITKVEVTIEGIPNQLFSQGMRAY